MSYIATPFAELVAGTEPEPFDWEAHSAMLDERAAALHAAIDRWRETARAIAGHHLNQDDER